MKKLINMKNRLLKITLILSAFVLSLGCSSDDYTGDSTMTPSNPTLNVTLAFANTQTFVERDDSFPFTVSISEPQIVNVVVYLTASGSATEGEDFTYPHSLTIPIGATSASGSIDVFRDSDPELTETVMVQIGTGLESNVSSINGQTVSITLQDYVACNWILEVSDTYGDGWNGGMIVATSEGVTTEYAAPDVDPGEIVTYEILIADGADYSFTYVSGGGTGGAPGWESENYFKLTAPDGTVWEEGSMDYSSIPTPGVITSGTNNCN